LRAVACCGEKVYYSVSNARKWSTSSK